MRPDGEERVIHAVAENRFNESGQAIGLFGISHDITEQKRAEVLLQESESCYWSLFKNNHSVMLLIAPETGMIMDANPPACSFYGYRHEDSVKLKITDINRLTAEQVKTEMQPARAGERNRFYFQHRLASGQIRDVEVYSGPISIAGKQLFYSIIHDITERKRAEEALRDASEKLKFFAYSVAHDLKSPAVGIYGLTRRLHKQYKGCFDEKGRNYCDQILKASEHVAALVEKVKIYIATKEACLSLENINFKDILRMVKDEFSSQLRFRQIQWLQPETTIEIRADRLSILRVLRNLVDSSLKCGGERLSKIQLRYEESENFHILSVSDDGKGLR